MRTIILSAALALGTLGFVSAPTAEAGPRGHEPGVGYRGGYHGGRSYHGYRSWGGYRHGHQGYYRGYYGNPYRGGYYNGVRPYSGYGHSQTLPGYWGGYCSQPGYGW